MVPNLPEFACNQSGQVLFVTLLGMRKRDIVYMAIIVVAVDPMRVALPTSESGFAFRVVNLFVSICQWDIESFRTFSSQELMDFLDILNFAWFFSFGGKFFKNKYNLHMLLLIPYPLQSQNLSNIPLHKSHL